MLNFFFLGAGYYYMGYKKVFQIQTRGFMLAVGVVYIILDVIFASLSVGAVGNLLVLLIAIFLAVDGMRKANGQPSWIQAEASPEQHTIGQSVILGLVIGIIVVIISIFV